MNRFGGMLVIFVCLLCLIVFLADVGAGTRYWGWLSKVPLGDKIGHFSLMCMFCLIANLAFSESANRSKWWISPATLIVVLVVVAEEFSQRWIPGRSFDLLDLAADFLGILCGDVLSRKFPLGMRFYQAQPEER